MTLTLSNGCGILLKELRTNFERGHSLCQLHHHCLPLLDSPLEFLPFFQELILLLGKTIGNTLSTINHVFELGKKPFAFDLETGHFISTAERFQSSSRKENLTGYHSVT